MDHEKKRIDPIAVQRRLEKSCLEQGLGEETAHDVAFHMTDWSNDLIRLWAFCEDPDSFSFEEIDEMLMDLLVHAPNHLAAAARLYTGIGVRDIFEVGAVETD
ncbi:MAG: hypothetical protein KC996_07175 [Phycisphaerales bacterium]|nr:hypothetical protein [Phycisphaerales bacterium]